MARRQRNNLIPVAGEENIGSDQQCADPQLNESGKGAVVRIGFLDKVDASYCRCLLDYAAVTARDWLAQEQAPRAEQVAHIAQAIAYALGADRRAVVEISAPTPPPWLPVRVLAGTGQENGRGASR